MAAPATIAHYVAVAREQLLHAGISRDEAALDARVLAQHVLGWSAATLITSGDSPVTTDFAHRYQMAVRRRAAREPLAYITGVKEFWNLRFEVSPSVLIPRPETEALVESFLERVPAKRPRTRVADVCTGSGCIAVAIAYERPNVHVAATDLSEAALAVAGRNAERHGVRHQLALVRTDLMNGVGGPFDAIVSNPPYVRESDRGGLQAEVKLFEPALALFAGDDGLAVVRGLIDQSAARLAPGGLLFFEFGDGQEPAVRELIAASGTLTMVDVKHDLHQIARVAIAARRPSA
jgi:release factor glutamine methyltransferase